MEKEEVKVSKTQLKKQEAQAYNAVNEIMENVLYIGNCSKCKMPLMMYLKSKPENICNYYCVQCGHKGNIKDIDKEDTFFFPIADIVNEVSKHYDKEEFDKAYNS
jgi:hypothetical protein